MRPETVEYALKSYKGLGLSNQQLNQLRQIFLSGKAPTAETNALITNDGRSALATGRQYVSGVDRAFGTPIKNTPGLVESRQNTLNFINRYSQGPSTSTPTSIPKPTSVSRPALPPARTPAGYLPAGKTRSIVPSPKGPLTTYMGVQMPPPPGTVPPKRGGGGFGRGMRGGVVQTAAELGAALIPTDRIAEGIIGEGIRLFKGNEAADRFYSVDMETKNAIAQDPDLVNKMYARKQSGAQNNNSPQLSDQTLSADSGFDPRFARTIKASSREFATDVPGVDQEANRIAAMGSQPLVTTSQDRQPLTTRLSGSTPAPDGSRAAGTQMSMRQPSPEEMLSFLGGAQNLARYGRAASDLVPGMGIREADVPLSRLANEDDMEDMLYGGRTPEEINRLQRGEALDEVVIDSDYELSDAEKGQKSTDDIKKMVRERNAMRKAEKPETQTKKTVERPQVDGKTDYMVPYRNAEMMRRGAFLDAGNSLQGLRNREMQQGFINAGNKKYAITDEFLKSNDPADLGPELSGEEVSQLKAQELLNDNIKNVTAASATAQNPMLGLGEGFDATDGKTTKYMDVSTANFAENNATPAEMNKEFDPFGYDPEFEQYDQNYFG